MLMTWRMESVALALGGLASGLVAAWFWLQSTKVTIDPSNGDPNFMMSGDPQLEELTWRVAGLRSNQQTGALNAIAARWTAAAVVLSTASTLVGLFA